MPKSTHPQPAPWRCSKKGPPRQQHFTASEGDNDLPNHDIKKFPAERALSESRDEFVTRFNLPLRNVVMDTIKLDVMHAR